MSNTEIKEKLWKKLIRIIIRAGPLPFPITDALKEITRILVNIEQAQFIVKAFGIRANVNIDEVKKRAGRVYSEDQINSFLAELMDNGIITGVPSKRTGIMVYHLMPFFPGLFEFAMMKGEKGDKQKKLAQLFDTIFGELAEITQENYDSIIPQFKNFNALDRVVPVEEEISDIESEVILPFEEVSKIVDNQDIFAVVHCYCRIEKDLLGKSCKVTDDRKNCLMFGKTASFAIDHGFGEKATKDEILSILKKVEEQGLVHKALHVGLDPDKEIEGICNCCKCCCGILELYYRGVTPLMSYSSFIAEVNEDDCVGCGTCEERCPIEAIELVDNMAIVDKDKCFGCGICSNFCPEKAINLQRTGPRTVFVPPPRLKTN